MRACDIECRAVDNNMDEAVVSDCVIIIVAIFFLRLVLRRFFSILVGVITSVTLGGTTKYVLMKFKVLLLQIIYSNTGESSKLDE